MAGFKIWSKYSEFFFVGVPQFDITSVLGTKLKRLCILGKKISTAQLHLAKPELRFCAGSNPARGVSGIRDGEDL